MKKIIIIVLILLNMSAKAQNLTPNDLLKISNYQSPNPTKFRLYPTNNIWTFLRLNTSNGIIDMIVYDIERNYQGIVNVNSKSLVENGSLDRYKLLATNNVWIFILLDQIDGKVYKVKWGEGAENRYLEEIL